MTSVSLSNRPPSWFVYRAAIAVATILLVVLVVWLLRTLEHEQIRWLPRCLFFHWTGLHCPGCGGTRSVLALVHGEFWLAVRCNPLLLLGTPLIGLIIYRQNRHEQRGGLAAPRMVLAVFVLMTVYFVARNVPSPSRSPLAPPDIKVTRS